VHLSEEVDVVRISNVMNDELPRYKFVLMLVVSVTIMARVICMICMDPFTMSFIRMVRCSVVMAIVMLQTHAL
jgi:hypothetical protein